ncbi:DnaD domain-containing protein [Eremococcus coleocola]|uniref:DnaD domain-containing protein n=1 Tax=Eremococcus coleocola TaxID=88132 RepID=UPI000412825A|nr:DnaD domain protein [Eremococcus coleocola]
MNSSIYDWMKDGFTLVPNRLIRAYADLNLSGDELILIMYLMSQIAQSQAVDEIEVISNHLGMESQKVFQLLDALLTKQYLSIELRTNKQGKQTDHYTLRPLFEHLDETYFNDKNKNEGPQPIVKQSRDLVQKIQKEFGRPVNSNELETINAWLSKDKYSPALVLVALREAAIHQALNIAYIDKILLNWEKQNIHTVAQAEAQIQVFNNNYQSQKQDQKDLSAYEIPLYDWDELNT